jgi:hypothetical protein
MTSMIWELFVTGLLLYGLTFLGVAVFVGGRQSFAVAGDAGTNWSRPHPRVTTQVRTTINWTAAARRPARRAACGVAHRAIRAPRRVPRRR